MYYGRSFLSLIFVLTSTVCFWQYVCNLKANTPVLLTVLSYMCCSRVSPVSMLSYYTCPLYVCVCLVFRIVSALRCLTVLFLFPRIEGSVSSKKKCLSFLLEVTFLLETWIFATLNICIVISDSRFHQTQLIPPDVLSSSAWYCSLKFLADFFIWLWLEEKKKALNLL